MADTKKLRTTSREREAIALHRAGKTRDEIAEALGTTRNHIWACLSVFEKTVSDHQRAIARAVVLRKRAAARLQDVRPDIAPTPSSADRSAV